MNKRENIIFPNCLGVLFKSPFLFDIKWTRLFSCPNYWNKNSRYFLSSINHQLLLLSVVLHDRIYDINQFVSLSQKLSHSVRVNEYFRKKPCPSPSFFWSSFRVSYFNVCIQHTFPRENSFDKVGRCTRVKSKPRSENEMQTLRFFFYFQICKRLEESLPEILNAAI